MSEAQEGPVTLAVPTGGNDCGQFHKEPAKQQIGGAAPKPLSYIEPFEEVIARKLVDDQFKALTGKPFGLRPGGYMVAVKIYVRPEEIKKIKRDDGTEASLYITPNTQSEDKYQSVAALVCAVGPQAYKGKDMVGNERFPEGPWCKVGDWVAIPRYEAFLVSYRGVALGLLPDDKILAVIEDPTDVAAINLADKV